MDSFRLRMLAKVHRSAIEHNLRVTNHGDGDARPAAHMPRWEQSRNLRDQPGCMTAHVILESLVAHGKRLATMDSRQSPDCITSAADDLPARQGHAPAGRSCSKTWRQLQRECTQMDAPLPSIGNTGATGVS
jgi:hypothetical protein